MTIDIRITVDFLRHRKTKNLIATIGKHAPLYLLLLWIDAAENRPRGELTGYTAKDIEAVCGWEGSENMLVEGLIKARFLNRNAGVYSIHNWDIRQKWIFASDSRANNNRFNGMARNHRTIYMELKENGIDSISEKEYVLLTNHLQTVEELLANRMPTACQPLAKPCGNSAPIPIPIPINKKIKKIKQKKQKRISGRLKRNTPPGFKRPVITKTDPSHPKNIIYLSLAKKFYKILKTNGKLNPNTKINEIAKDFRYICEIDLKKNGFDLKQAKKKLMIALSFYKNHCGDKYIPLAFSGNSFRNKFNQIEAAIDRSKETWGASKKEFMDDSFQYGDGIAVDK